MGSPPRYGSESGLPPQRSFCLVHCSGGGDTRMKLLDTADTGDSSWR